MKRTGRSVLTWPIVIASGVGLLLGIVLTLAGLVLFAPQPSTTPPATATEPYDAAITVGDTFLTSALSDGIAQAQLPVTLTNVHAHVETGNQLQVSGDMSGLPIFFGAGPRRLTAELTLSVDSGQLQAHINRASIGGLDLPRPITAALESAINQKLSATAESLAGGNASYAVVGVTSTTGRLTLLVQHR